MRIARYFLWIGILLVGVLQAGCQADPETTPGPESQPVKGLVAIRSQVALENEAHSSSLLVGGTKSDNDETLVYTLEVWSRETNPRCMLRKTVNGSMTEGVQLEIALIPGSYDFLLWADYGNGRYLTTNLREVTVVTDSYRTDAKHDAFACAQQVEWEVNAVCQAILKRPVARIHLQNAEAFDQASEVSMIYDEMYTVYDVLTGEVSEPRQGVSVSCPATTVGSALIGEDFLFVPAGKETVSLSVSVDNVTKALEDVPVKSNYNTNVTCSF